MTDLILYRKFAALIAYQGHGTCGWQRQSGPARHGGPSIQGELEDALERLTGEKNSVVGSGRTDSGVNARGQVAHFRLSVSEKNLRWNPGKLRKGWNAHLPSWVRVIEIAEVPLEFHSQRSATQKQYSYYILQGPVALPDLALQTYYVPVALSCEAMQEALNPLIGSHDFKAFQASGGEQKSTVRTLFEAQVTRVALPFQNPCHVDSRSIGYSRYSMIRIRWVGSGFLKQMIRGLVGTLIPIGEGKLPESYLKAVVDSRERPGVGARVGTSSITTAPAQGLWLEWVKYDGFPELNELTSHPQVD